ncbi:hypothetical protein PAXRUDRAFT_829752 [Paxillus rubicundulus Ve08.2h10]|uniref:Uncharacterized protein n=1 Tax=Paxillus rubicundulus Ve08.2h10 TaxID=930991 RepID=A0A0D0DZM4_9AGAM|nr:hypothetical protein PAXRUDRAFT_829752 [Paxillus rubicundulus Ve08.2h10]
MTAGQLRLLGAMPMLSKSFNPQACRLHTEQNEGVNRSRFFRHAEHQGGSDDLMCDAQPPSHRV